MDNTKPIGPNSQDKAFTQKALETKFSYSFTRKQLVSLVGVLGGVQLHLGDARTLGVCQILDEVNRTAIQSLTNDDYEAPQPAIPETPEVQTN